MKPVLAFPVYNRPHYVGPALESWRAVRGIGDTYMVYRLEPGYPDMVDLVARERPEAAGLLTVNDHQLGNDQNMLAAVTDGFATGAGFVVAAEDDVVVSHDLLEYMLAMAAQYEHDRTVLAITAWQGEEPGPLDEVQRTPWFYGGACWGMWRDRWDMVKDGWPPSGVGYDGYLWRLAQAGGLSVIQPAATRCKNIGEVGTCTNASFGDTWARQRFTADIPPQDYREHVPV